MENSSEFTKVVDGAIEIANEALQAFDGLDALVVLPALVVLMTEIILQVAEDQKDASLLMSTLSESVLMNFALDGKELSASH
jgi:hypothetical protein